MGRRLGVKTRNKVWGRVEIVRSLEQTNDNRAARTDKCNELNSVHLRSKTDHVKVPPNKEKCQGVKQRGVGVIFQEGFSGVSLKVRMWQ